MKNIISINNLDFTYKKSQKHAISKVSFNIEAGEVFGFLGPNGAGKTTTQRLIIGLLTGYDGSIQIFDKERTNWDNSFYERIGVAFDFPNLYLKLTAMENLKLLGSYYTRKTDNIEGLLDEVGLLKDKDQRIENFSKGMKMRLNFVRSIMHNPDLFFFDEPTSGLDPVNAKIIKDKILALKKQGKTIFLTTHNMTVAEQLCDRVAFINGGELSAVDSPQNLMVKHGNSHVDIVYLNSGREHTLSLPADQLRGNLELVNIINNHDIRTIHSNEATLEDIFIKFTGRELI